MLNTGHEGARRIYDARGTLFQITLHLGRDAVRANHRRHLRVGFRWQIDGRDAFGFEPLHLLRIVYERAKAANGLALVERLFDHINSPLDAEAESVLVS
jgi:hypothetical protein